MPNGVAALLGLQLGFLGENTDPEPAPEPIPLSGHPISARKRVGRHHSSVAGA